MSLFSILLGIHTQEWNCWVTQQLFHSLKTHWVPFTHSPYLCVPIPQNLVEAAEEADLNHEFNESLVVSPTPGTGARGPGSPEYQIWGWWCRAVIY